MYVVATFLIKTCVKQLVCVHVVATVQIKTMFCVERPGSADIEVEHTTTEHFWLALEAFLCSYLTDTDAVHVVADFKQQYASRLKVCAAIVALRTVTSSNSQYLRHGESLTVRDCG